MRSTPQALPVLRVKPVSHEMEEEEKTREQLLGELNEMRERLAAAEQSLDELRRMREAFAQGIEALGVALANSWEITVLLRPDGTVAYVGPTVERITGYKPEELIGVYAFDLIHPDDVEELLRTFSTGLGAPGRAVTAEFRYRHADGGWHAMEAQGINLAHIPSVSGMVVNARDISERKRAEETLSARERYYRSLLRNVADMISVLDENLAFRWGSRSTALITGYRADEVYGKRLQEFLHPEDLEQAEQDLAEVLSNPGRPLTTERRFRHRDGSYHWHEAILTNLLHDPSVRGIIINSRDITERKTMEERLRASNRELDAFASTVAHDLRTPLSLIEGYAQLLRAETATEEEREAYLRSIISAARRMDELTQSLLEYAQSGQPEGTADPIEPLDLVSDILFEHADDIENTGIEVVLGEVFPAVRVNRYKLRQVFANLVNNAVKYLAGTADPRLEIGSCAQGDTVTFYVRDNGPGLDPALREEVFLPFKRFGPSRPPGLGIGLSTVKRAVEGWGGKVWVESQPGKGAAFFFTAPAA